MSTVITMRLVQLFVLALVLGVVLGGELVPQECPAECSCHYFRINWVSDCAHRGLRGAPSSLSPATYVLDMSGNRLSELALPSAVKPRRLLLANNRFTSLERVHFQVSCHITCYPLLLSHKARLM